MVILIFYGPHSTFQLKSANGLRSYTHLMTSSGLQKRGNPLTTQRRISFLVSTSTPRMRFTFPQSTFATCPCPTMKTILLSSSTTLSTTESHSPCFSTMSRRYTEAILPLQPRFVRWLVVLLLSRHALRIIGNLDWRARIHGVFHGTSLPPQMPGAPRRF